MVRDTARRSSRRGLPLAVLALATLLGGCATGARASLRPDSTAVGNAAVDAVLARLWALPRAVYTATYEATVGFDGSTAEVSATQASPVRHSLTIGDVRYLVDDTRVETCSLESGDCIPGHDAARVSNALLAPDFLYSNTGARLRRDFDAAIGPPVASTEETDGGTATCVTIPLPAPTADPTSAPQSVYCVLENGVLTRLDASDLRLTLTSYSDTADLTQLVP
jgi:hypothetical protein